MNAVELRVLQDGVVIDNHIVKVDSFLNQQMDVELVVEIGRLFYERFKNQKIDRVLTCEASGIGIAIMVAQYFKVPMVFAKKGSSLNMSDDVYQAKAFSYTKQQSYTFNVDKRFVLANKNVLIIDDFLANGEAVRGLIDIVNLARASVVGIGIVIEKGFQPGGAYLRDRGYNIASLCIIDKLENFKITLKKQAVL